MKLFKKLAAVMLVAALALTMVGCGKAAADIKSEINDYIADFSAMYDMGITHKDELDTVAQKLLDAANAASATEEAEDFNIYGLLEDADVQAAAGITEAEKYYYNVEKNYSYKSELLNNSKIKKLVDELMNHSYNLDTENNSYDYDDDCNIEYGIAVGKVGDQEYVLMLKVPTKKILII